MQKAKHIYQRAIKSGKKAWRPKHTLTLDIVNNLGVFFLQIKQYVGNRDHVSRGVRRQKEIVKTKAHVDDKHIPQHGCSL